MLLPTKWYYQVGNAGGLRHFWKFVNLKRDRQMRSFVKKVREEGLSLKVTSSLMLVFSLVITAVLMFATIRAFLNFRSLEQSTDVYIDLEEHASQLMDASDYLTEQVQCYTVILDRKYLDNYFREAFVTQRREAAIDAIEEQLPDSLALYELRDSMSHSLRLMNREYYAMKLVLIATEDTDIPEVLQNIQLDEADAALDPEEQIELAVSMVHDSEYYFQKNEVRRNLNDCLDALRNRTFISQHGMESNARQALISVMIMILIQSISICAILWLHTHLGIRPVLKAVDHIRKDESLPIMGASEIRYLAGAYNVMYNAFKNSIVNLNYKASHDKLTGVYNRAGYDIIKNSVDMSSTVLMIIDADKFKDINDNYGHEVGDKVLQKVASTLRKYYRSDDYVCRIGGDEFVVLMVHVPSDPHTLIETKIGMINCDLKNTDDGLPPVTLSVGVSFDDEGPDPDEMFRRADKALYYVKQNGRSGYCFYTEALGI